ncbi:MAG: hypothetical protein KatS3mg125_0617 [Lysobacterales bacterium]|jgi:hypothetical protein|nr:MAG: hypothetical protein KatS3mg125_0617 [Xanthomonadales bacterium]
MKVKFIRMILGVDASEASTPERIERAARAAAAELGTSLFFVETGASESPSGSPSGGGSASYGVQLIVAPHGVRSGREPTSSILDEPRREEGIASVFEAKTLWVLDRDLLRPGYDPEAYARELAAWLHLSPGKTVNIVAEVDDRHESGRLLKRLQQEGRAKGARIRIADARDLKWLHDRFWLDEDQRRAFCVGTSLNGLWKHLSVVMPLTPADSERLFDFLFRIQDIGQRLRELDDFLKDH